MERLDENHKQLLLRDENNDNIPDQLAGEDLFEQIQRSNPQNIGLTGWLKNRILWGVARNLKVDTLRQQIEQDDHEDPQVVQNPASAFGRTDVSDYFRSIKILLILGILYLICNFFFF